MPNTSQDVTQLVCFSSVSAPSWCRLSKMPKRCVAADCSNSPSEHIPLFSFPKDEELRDQWTKQVQRTRGSWVPTASSVLCSEHFPAHCFEEAPGLKEAFGLKVRYRRVIKPTAVQRNQTAQSSSSSQTLQEKSKLLSIRLGSGGSSIKSDVFKE